MIPALAVAWPLLVPGFVNADPPANDDWNTPIVWATDGPHTVDLRESTFESLEPDWAYRFVGWQSGAGSVWFLWTAGQTGWYEAEATGPVPTTVVVYEDGPLISLTRVENGNLLRSVTRPRFIFQAVEGRTYRIAVRGPQAASPEVRLRPVPPGELAPNDQRADATIISALPYDCSKVAPRSGLETGEPKWMADLEADGLPYSAHWPFVDRPLLTPAGSLWWKIETQVAPAGAVVSITVNAGDPGSMMEYVLIEQPDASQPVETRGWLHGRPVRAVFRMPAVSASQPLWISAGTAERGETTRRVRFQLTVLPPAADGTSPLIVPGPSTNYPTGLTRVYPFNGYNIPVVTSAPAPSEIRPGVVDLGSRFPVATRSSTDSPNSWQWSAPATGWVLALQYQTEYPAPEDGAVAPPFVERVDGGDSEIITGVFYHGCRLFQATAGATYVISGGGSIELTPSAPLYWSDDELAHPSPIPIVFGTEAFHAPPRPLNALATLADFDVFTQQVTLSLAEPGESSIIPVAPVNRSDPDGPPAPVDILRRSRWVRLSYDQLDPLFTDPPAVAERGVEIYLNHTSYDDAFELPWEANEPGGPYIAVYHGSTLADLVLTGTPAPHGRSYGLTLLPGQSVLVQVYGTFEDTAFNIEIRRLDAFNTWRVKNNLPPHYWIGSWWGEPPPEIVDPPELALPSLWHFATGTLPGDLNSPRLPHSTSTNGALELRWQVVNPDGIEVIAETSSDLGQGEEGWLPIPVVIDTVTGETVVRVIPAAGESKPPRQFLRTRIKLSAPQERPNDDWDP
jgi:hypothetical protein